ncbi:hypothetical protein BC826DRAFT_1178231 [Russula brevipes]|nr:hypothetical protein BC826DRAFT_1178231 [Russula brevipes]
MTMDAPLIANFWGSKRLAIGLFACSGGRKDRLCSAWRRRPRPRFSPQAPLATRRPPRKEAPLKITSGGPLQGVPLRFGRSLVCGPFGLAHGFDRACLRRFSSPRFSPRALLATRRPPPKVAPPSRPRVAALSRVARSASVGRHCARQTSPVGPARLDHAPLRSLNRLALGLEIARPKLLASKVCQKDERGRERGKVLGPGLAVVGARIRVILDSGLPQQRVWLDRPNVFRVHAACPRPFSFISRLALRCSPARVAEAAQPQPPWPSPRKLTCACPLVAAALFLAGK